MREWRCEWKGYEVHDRRSSWTVCKSECLLSKSGLLNMQSTIYSHKGRRIGARQVVGRKAAS